MVKLIQNYILYYICIVKELIFIRHAKSDWDDPSLRDIDRPLSPRGLKVAPIMATKLKSIIDSVDLIVTSPAKRAIETAEYFGKIFNIDYNFFEIKHELYEAYADEILAEVRLLDDNLSRVMFFGHNPGYTYLVNMFSKEFIENISTCGIFRIVSKAEKWRELDTSNSKLDFYIKP